MKKNILAIAILLASQLANAGYSDSLMASSEAISPFDRAYEAGKAQKMSEPVDYRKTEAVPAAVIDLSVDEPVISVEETETERRYRATLVELEQVRKSLDTARADREMKLQSAQLSAAEADQRRVNALLAQKAEIEEQRKSIEIQRAAVRAQEDAVKKALAKNDQALADAEQMKLDQLVGIEQIRAESAQILMMAEQSAEAIETAASTRVTLERVDPTVVLNEPIKAEYQAATLKEIVTGLMPIGWRVRTDFSVRPELENRRYEFVSTDPRDLALRKLTGSVRDAKVRFAYFWDLEENGKPSPMILITDRPY